MTADTALIPLPSEPERGARSAGRVANAHAAAALFADYRSRRAQHLCAGRTTPWHSSPPTWSPPVYRSRLLPPLSRTLAAWRRATWGLVAGFTRQQPGRATPSARSTARASTVKVYARLAMQAGSLDWPSTSPSAVQATPHRGQAGGRGAAGRARRDQEGRAGPAHVGADLTGSRRSPTRPRAGAAALLFCLLLDHGLRVGEVSRVAGERPTWRWASCASSAQGRPDAAAPPLPRPTAPGGSRPRRPRATCRWRVRCCAVVGRGLADGRRHERARSPRARELGAAVGGWLERARPAAAAWATRARRNGTPLDRCRMRGWSSPAMPLRYVEAARWRMRG